MGERNKEAFFQLAISGASIENRLNEETFFLRLIAAGFTVDAAGVITITTAPVFSGASLTNLNASNLSSGTVPLARLSGITNTQISASAAIAQSKLSLSITNAEVNASAAISQSKLALDITNAEVNASAAIAWTKISKTGSSLADLTTRSAADLSSGTLADARFPATLPAASGVNLTALNGANIASGTIATARLGSGTADATTYLRGDSTWQAISSPGGADLVFTGNYAIRRNTSDGSDSGSLILTGGGATGQSRGGQIEVYGNENGEAGNIRILLGVVAGSQFAIRAGTNSYDAFKVVESTGIVSSLGIYNTTDVSSAVGIDSSGKMFRVTSSVRYKTNIEPMAKGSWRWLLNVTPVDYNLKQRPNGRTWGGLTAEDVTKYGPKGADGSPIYAGLNDHGKPEDVAYSNLTAPLIVAVQELHARLEAVEKRIH